MASMRTLMMLVDHMEVLVEHLDWIVVLLLSVLVLIGAGGPSFDFFGVS